MKNLISLEEAKQAVDSGMEVEYKDGYGNWYPYTKQLRENKYFPGDCIKSHENVTKNDIIKFRYKNIIDFYQKHHAVRWGQRRNRDGEIVWTSWHWTDDANKTICGRYISVGDSVSFLPDIEENSERVDCIICQKKLEKNEL